MNSIDVFKTIYLGDRACKKIIFDTWDRIIKTQIDNISRVRGENWGFHESEDLVNGYIVMKNVKNFNFSPNGVLPNDYINFFQLKKIPKKVFIFFISILAQ